MQKVSRNALARRLRAGRVAADRGGDAGPVAELRAAVAHLEERVERVERHQARLQESVIAQLRRGDMVSEDLAAALETMRGRVEALEAGGARPGA